MQLEMENSRMKKLILFGAGVYAKKYLSLLEYLDIPFDYFTDNNTSIYGNKLFGKEIIPPEKLCTLECNVIISCTHTEPIKKQLGEMGILHKLIDIKDIYQNYIEKMGIKKGVNDSISSCKKHKSSKMNILVDMYEGIGWGGTEIWAAEIARGLSYKGYHVILGGSELQVPLGKEYEKYVERFTSENTIKKMCDTIENNLPCVIINNFAGCMFLAASVMKIKYPDDIKIVSVIHNDNTGLYDAHMMLRDDIDSIICVSCKIRQRIIEKYNWNVNKIYFKEQPIAYDGQFTRQYWKNDTPIKIGYAGRMVKQQKRAHLIPRIIEMLEEKHLDYLLEIAGEGECIDMIQKFIMEKKLEDKVMVVGRIDKDKMPDFWKRQDVFINLSEYEGMSLAMLEAMSYGCVPVVTDVSGTQEFIEDGVNGYVCNVDHVEEIVKGIEKLTMSESNVENFSKRCEVEIKTRCNKDNYIDYVEKIICDCWS